MIGEVIAKRLSLIGQLSDGDRDALLGIKGSIRELRRGEDVLRQGDRPRESVVVLQGWLQRYKVSPEGRRQIHSFYMASDTPSLEALPMEIMDNSLGAVAPSRVGTVPAPELLRVINERPNLAMLIWRETLVQAAVFREWLMRNSQLLAHVQLAHLFCEIMTRARAAGLVEQDSCDLPLTQEDLADVLGMSPVHVNRTLGMLRAGGFVEFRSGKLTIGNWPKLVETAEFDPGYLHLRSVTAPNFLRSALSFQTEPEVQHVARP